MTNQFGSGCCKLQWERMKTNGGWQPVALYNSINSSRRDPSRFLCILSGNPDANRMDNLINKSQSRPKDAKYFFLCASVWNWSIIVGVDCTLGDPFGSLGYKVVKGGCLRSPAASIWGRRLYLSGTLTHIWLGNKIKFRCLWRGEHWRWWLLRAGILIAGNISSDKHIYVWSLSGETLSRCSFNVLHI